MDFFKSKLQETFGLSHDDLNLVAPLFNVHKLAKGDYFTKEGQHCKSLSFINNGYLRIFSKQQTKEVTQWISSKGYFVTELSSFMFDRKSRWNIQALTEVELVSITKSNYAKLRQQFSCWDELEKKFIAHCFLTLEERVHQLISLKAKERYELLMQYDPELFHQVPQQYLASMLGMSPETFSRIRADTIS